MGVTLPLRHIRKPVRRSRADRYLLWTLLGFAGSVIVTRAFLELTGYPQIGSGSLHIAHVLWGGLLLFIATLLPLILANRSTHLASALVGGIGVGLFIDEVGKFITRSNDYFYPAAAPIIYAFFLVTVFLYLQLARVRQGDVRAEMYAALDDIQDVIDRPLQPGEQMELERRLEHIMQHQERPDLANLAEALYKFIHSDAVVLRHRVPTFWDKLAAWAHRIEEGRISRRVYRSVLVAGLLLASVPSLFDSLQILFLVFKRGPAPEAFAITSINASLMDSPRELTWLFILVILVCVCAMPLVYSALLLLARREQWGITLAFLGLLFSLTMLDLLLFYYQQFLALETSLVHFALLLAVLHYRKRFLC